MTGNRKDLSEEGARNVPDQPEHGDQIFLMEEARYQSRIFQGTEVFVNYWGYSAF
ncbi:MAG TPA: hypothetical protein VL625_08720 [Patescibacteria group bacterium]|nr:hypothetical protein [Patescibacteria group bacterium]